MYVCCYRSVCGQTTIEHSTANVFTFLLVIYIGDLTVTIPLHHLVKFVDDCTLLIPLLRAAMDNSAAEFQHILDWCMQNGMSVNFSKNQRSILHVPFKFLATTKCIQH